MFKYQSKSLHIVKESFSKVSFKNVIWICIRVICHIYWLSLMQGCVISTSGSSKLRKSRNLSWGWDDKNIFYRGMSPFDPLILWIIRKVIAVFLFTVHLMTSPLNYNLGIFIRFILYQSSKGVWWLDVTFYSFLKC